LKVNLTAKKAGVRAESTKTPSKIDEKQPLFDQKGVILGLKSGKNDGLRLLIG
jgi:hypothetical protein